MADRDYFFEINLICSTDRYSPVKCTTTNFNLKKKKLNVFYKIFYLQFPHQKKNLELHKDI